MMQAGTYSDFSLVTLEVDEKTQKLSKNIKIDQIRNLIHEVSLTHQYDRLKIAVIYPAEAMNRASANALLKTLEEPAPRVLILLATHNLGRVPITLRSRCQSWSLNLPPREQAREWLTREGVDPADVDGYLNYAGGDAELALELRQGDYAELVERFKSRFGLFLRGGLGLQGRGFHGFGRRQQALAHLGQAVALGVAVEKLGVQICLQGADAPGHGGVVHLQAPGRGGQLPGTGDGEKEFQIVPAHGLKFC